MLRAYLALTALMLVATLDAEDRLNLDAPITRETRITDPRILRPCDLGMIVAQIGHAVDVPVGLEKSRDCELTLHGDPGPTTEGTENLKGRSLRQALDYLMTFMPEFSWKQMDGAIVVRPKSAWDDARNVLNLPTAAFNATDQPLDDVLHILLKAVTPKVYVPHTDVADAGRPINRPVTLAFRGGTMLDALNTVIRLRPGLDWQLGYVADRPFAEIQIGTAHYGGKAHVESGHVGAMVVVPQDH